MNSNSSLNVDYLAELEGDTLSLYGSGALEALDKNWGMAAAGAVTTIIFKFVDFDEICKHFHKVRARFPSTHVSLKSKLNHPLHACNMDALGRHQKFFTVEPLPLPPF